MPLLIVTEGAAIGLRRCRQFLATQNPGAAERAGQVIARHLTALETTPAMGRPFGDHHDLRELVMAFGKSGYVALYRHAAGDDVVYLLAFRHQREVGYTDRS